MLKSINRTYLVVQGADILLLAVMLNELLTSQLPAEYITPVSSLAKSDPNLDQIIVKHCTHSSERYRGTRARPKYINQVVAEPRLRMKS